MTTLSRIILFTAVAWSRDLAAFGVCCSRLARNVLDRSFRAKYQGEVKLEPAEVDS